MNVVVISKERLYEKYSVDLIKWIRNFQNNLIGIYYSYDVFLEQMDNNVSSLVFFVEIGCGREVDINITHVIQKQFPQSDIIILSDKKDYAYEVFQKNIKDYLVYPFNIERYKKTEEKIAKGKGEKICR